jgi:hypothetical protein
MLVVEPLYYRVSLNPSNANYYKGSVHTSAGESDSRASKRGNIKTSSPHHPYSPPLYLEVCLCVISPYAWMMCITLLVVEGERKELVEKVFAGGKEEEEATDQLHM